VGQWKFSTGPLGRLTKTLRGIAVDYIEEVDDQLTDDDLTDKELIIEIWG